MTTLTKAAAGPVTPIERYATGWEIRTLVTQHDATGIEGEPGYEPAHASYARVIVPALSAADVAASVTEQQDGDPVVLTQAQAVALDALAPEVAEHDAAIDDIITTILGG